MQTLTRAVRRMPGKKALAASIARRSGLTWAAERLPRKPSLMVLTYHRVCDVDRVAGDPNVVSTSPDGFERQLARLKRVFPIVGLEEALAHVSSPRARGATLLITFDDGYKDNYDNAFPILKSLGLSATFFLVGSFVGSSEPPWWDRIAHAVRRTAKTALTLRGEPAIAIGATESSRVATVREILRLYKGRPGPAAQALVEEVEDACGVRMPATERLFLNWDEAAEMLKGGMDIGTHTHTHPILSRIPPDRQLWELSESRRVIESHLKSPMLACAYPVGSRDAYDANTMDAARRSGYRAAFTFEKNGSNVAGRSDMFKLTRLDISPDLTLPLIELRLALLANTGRLYV